MIKQLIASVFGTRHEREVRRLQPLVDTIHAEEARLRDLSDAEIQAQTARFRGIIAARTDALKQELDQVRVARHGSADAAEREVLEDRYQDLDAQYRRTIAAVLDEILPEAFATVREACRRLVGTTVSVTGHDLTWDMVPYDVQLIGGIVLHQGRIAEMATGEGKTLVATLPLYLNALTGRGAHLVTVNNYLARRDSQWMGHVFRWLGLTVACLDDTEPSTPERRAAYLSDITYGTNNEFGFDYLRDNMVFGLEQRVQREYIYAIIDEVDSILIDEARTPLIISGPVAHEGDDSYARFNRQVFELVRKQTDVVNALLSEGEKLLADDKRRGEAGIKLYQAQLGMPKSKRLMKLLNEIGREAAGAAGRARRHRRPEAAVAPAADAEPRGGALLRARREGPLGAPHGPGRRHDVAERPGALPGARTSPRRCTRSRRTRPSAPPTGSSSAARSRRRTPRRARRCTSSTSCCRRTSSTRATSTTSCRTARSSSSTSSPAASCRAAAGRTGCTRRSRPRKACTSRARRRPSPRSPSRTTSGCTRSSPA